MIITCKECNTRFNLDENLLKPTGSKVRCSKCNEVFTAYPPEISERTEPPVEAAPEIEDQPDVAAPETGEKETAGEDVLDFSGMEKLLDEEEAAAGEGAADEGTEDLDLDLDLDITPEVETKKEGLEAGAKPQEGEDLDLSDLENLLDAEESVPESVGDEIDEELKLEADSDFDAAAKVPPKKDGFEELDELDLSDLEEILDLEEPMAEDESAPEDIELELDMEAEPELEASSADDEDEEIDKVDLSEIEKMLEVEEAEEQKEPEEKNLEFDLEMEETSAGPSLTEAPSDLEVYELDEAEETSDKPEAVEAAADAKAKPEFEFEEGAEEEAVEEEVPDVTPAVAAAAAPAKERRVSKPLVVLLILVLLAGGSYGAYVLLNYMHIQIPYVSNYFKPKVPDPKGNLKIETLDVNSRFILNIKAGKLFIITGKVKNGYSDNRRFISVIGKLFTKGKKIVKTETVFCGNVLSDIELSNMEFEAIKKRLSNRYGDNRSNFQVEPGKQLPFMIVFSDLPDNLEEFAIEAAGSISASTSG
jgi:pilus assembly protein FimV